jgi:type IV secretory pathway VirB10-like protein
MDWVLDHLQMLFVIAVAVVAILQKFKRARPGAAGAGPAAEDNEQAERTRRIQEEIRRRIMERRGLAPGPPPASATSEEPPPFPAAPPMIEEVRPFVVPPPLEQVMAAPAAADNTRELERQQQMLGQLRDLEAARQDQAYVIPASTAGAVAAASDAGRSNRLLAELRQPAGLRRAVLLREILGPPVGLG